MNKIEELIKKISQSEVQYRTIQDICNISRGRVMSKDYIKNNEGEYSVYSSQTENGGELGKISTYDFDGEYLTWTTDGANAGSIFYRNGKFSVTNVCGLLKVVSNEINAKYLYYILSKEAKNHVNYGMGNPKLMSNVMAKICVPIPPIEIQNEIVQTLNNFTELEAELETELEARNKQYEYYRDKLLFFDKNIIRKKLGEICKLSAGGDINKKDVVYERNKEYRFPVYSNGIEENSLYGYTNSYKVEAPCVTISARGTIGWTCLRKENFYPIVRLICAKPNNEVDISYLKYYLETIKFQVPKTGIPQLTVPMVEKYQIPIPPLEEQKKIVSVLDKFDKLCNDTTQGLPAEIEARRKQYEYYRDKLLNFKESKLEK